MASKPARAAWRARLLAASRLALSTLQRMVPGEPSRVLILTLVAGALCGLAAVAFHLAIQVAEHLLIARAAVAAVIERAILGVDPEFRIPSGFSFDHIETVIFYGLLSVLAAVVSIARPSRGEEL